MASVRVAVPRIPGRINAFAGLKASGNCTRERTCEKAMASDIAKSDPKRATAKSAHTKYIFRAVREMIQLLVIGKYNIRGAL